MTTEKMALYAARETVETSDVVVSFLHDIIADICRASNENAPIDPSFAWGWSTKLKMMTSNLEEGINILNASLIEAGIEPDRGFGRLKTKQPAEPASV